MPRYIKPMEDTLQTLKFSIPEILSLIGLVQCVYVLVYMSFRAGGWSRAVLPFAYFFFLGAAFFIAFAERFIGDVFKTYDLLQWFLWYLGPPLSVLLIIQIAKITEPPSARNYWVLMLVPAAMVAAFILDSAIPDSRLYDWLTLTGLLAGVISILAIWSQRPVLANLTMQPGGQDRYWLILALVLVNLAFLGTSLAALAGLITAEQLLIIHTLWGLGFVYLAGTSLFRIYPQAIRLIERTNQRQMTNLSAEDREIAGKIENLMKLDKVYHEPAYNRVNLAQELGVSETTVSKIINQHFGKTLPQLFSEYRVADARQLLRETDMPIRKIGEDVGFNSIATFNRVFRDIEGQSPGQYRDALKGKAAE